MFLSQSDLKSSDFRSGTADSRESVPLLIVRQQAAVADVSTVLIQVASPPPVRWENPLVVLRIFICAPGLQVNLFQLFVSRSRS